MSSDVSIYGEGSAAPHERARHAMADALADPGWGVFPRVLGADLLQELFQLARQQEFNRVAKIGRHLTQQRDTRVRLDRTVWIDNAHPTQQVWLDWAAQLQLLFNRSLMMGLSFFESHYAYYAPGAFYKKHLDTFQGPDQKLLSDRAVSIVLYLNPDWASGDGGELVLYGSEGEVLIEVAPKMGTMVLFNSADFVHEVRPAQAPRFSIAGWFHRQPASALALPIP